MSVDRSTEAHFNYFDDGSLTYINNVLKSLNSVTAPSFVMLQIGDVPLNNEVGEQMGTFKYLSSWQGGEDKFVFIPYFVEKEEDA